MEFLIFGIEVSISKKNNPLSKLNKRKVERLAISQDYYSNGVGSKQIARIKAVRAIIPGTGIKEAKDWVDSQRWDNIKL